jgi:hypothetical protein
MTKPTHDDAQIMLQLVRAWPAEATDWVWSPEFVPDHDEFNRKYLDAGEEASRVRAILNWYETIGTLYKHGLLNQELLFDWLAISHVWERMKSHALAWRQESGEPRMYENFEMMASAQLEWEARQQRAA